MNVYCDSSGCTDTDTEIHYDYTDDTDEDCTECCTDFGCYDTKTTDFDFYSLSDPTNTPTAYDTTSNDCDYYNNGDNCNNAFTQSSAMMYGAVGLGGIAVVAALLGRKVRDNMSFLCSPSFPIHLT